MFDRYEKLIDEGLPIWEFDPPKIMDNMICISMYNAVTGEIRTLRLTMNDVVLLNKTGAFARHEEGFDEWRKSFLTFVETCED